MSVRGLADFFTVLPCGCVRGELLLNGRCGSAWPSMRAPLAVCLHHLAGHPAETRRLEQKVTQGYIQTLLGWVRMAGDGGYDGPF